MKTNSAPERVTHELHRVLDRMRMDLDRIEILAEAMNAFGRPVPDYEPGFRHLKNLTLGAHQIG